MRLKTRLILVVLLVSWIPLAVVSGLLSWRTDSRFHEEHRAQQEELLRAVSAEIGRTVERIDKVLAGVADGETLREELIQPLERGVFYGEPERERRVLQEVRALINDADLQTLRLVDLEEGGRLIALGHDGPDDSPEPEVVRWARQKPGSAKLRREEILRDGRVEGVWTLQVLRLVGERVALVGGRILSSSWLEALHRRAGEGNEAALEDAEGARVVSTFEQEPSESTTV